MRREGLPRWIFLGALTLVVFQLIAPCLCEAMAPMAGHCAMAGASTSPCALHSKSIERPQAVSASMSGCCCKTVRGVSVIATVTAPGAGLPIQNMVDDHRDFSIVAAATTALPALLPFHSQPLNLRI